MKEMKEISTPTVQLGFSQPCEKSISLGHESPNWKNWDGGKIGGRPSFLNPRDIPQAPLRCQQCMYRDGTDRGTILRFIAQIYSPADEDTQNDDAYHRTLYVFACPHPKCSSEDTPIHPSLNLSSSIIVLRCQLPKLNEFFPLDCKSAKTWKKHSSEYWNVNKCVVCGLRATGKCPKMNKWFCCKEHQLEYYTIYASSSNTDNVYLNSVYEESELIVEDEPDEVPMTEDDLQKVLQTSMFISEEEETDQDKLGVWNQNDLNELTGIGGRGVTDINTIEFYTRIGRGQGDVKGQCLRYCRWPHDVHDVKSPQDTEEDWVEFTVGPLWISSIHRPCINDIPCCQYCGSDRRFEFQIMPQMLHFLTNNIHRKRPVIQDNPALKDAILATSNIIDKATDEGLELEIPDDIQQAHEDLKERMKNNIIKPKDDKFHDTLDFGVISVYTCIKSCGGGEDKKVAYRQEFAWRQPPLRFDK